MSLDWTKEEFEALDAEYRSVFDAGIPLTMLPYDTKAATALIREAIATRDEGVFERDLPEGALI